MPNENNLNELPQASIERPKRFRVSVVWIIPILAAVVAIGIAVQRILNEGPTITIVFKAAEGVEAGKTFLKYKEVTVGTVSAVQLSDDFTKVVVKAKIAKYAAGLMVDDTTFWIVAPRVTLSGISGLGTLLSGNYIGLAPGKATRHRHEYIGLDVPPPITDQPGRLFVLKADSLGSVGIGAPVYYRSLSVGQVIDYNLSSDGKAIDVKVFVDSPYDKYVTPEARFWNASGINVSAGANGVEVHTESLVAVLVGGIAFDAPGFAAAGEPAAANSTFTLYPDQTTAMRQPDVRERRYVLYFNESLRGLSVGAPVTLWGLTVGRVTSVDLTYDPATLKIRPRTIITFSPARLLANVSQQEQASVKALLGMSEEKRTQVVRRMVEEQGLRARLQTGNLLSGELYVALEYHPNAPKAHIDWSGDPLELPVASGGLASIEDKLDSILTKVDRMPLDAMGTQVKDALVKLNTTLKDANVLIERIDTQLVPAATETLQQLHTAIANGDQALFGKESAGPQDLRDTLVEVAGAARAVRVLVDYLQRHPEALIRGKKEEEKP
jgi:paraquat-inducible protein B